MEDQPLSRRGASSTSTHNPNRRRLVGAIGIGIGGQLITGHVPGATADPTTLTPSPISSNLSVSWLQPNLSGVKAAAKANLRIDAHAHFFNASDVTVKGYLAGPVAHSFGPLGFLLKLLAPIADQLATIAPTAEEELAELEKKSRAFSGAPLAEISSKLESDRLVHQDIQSQRFYDFITGTEFEKAYNKLPPDGTGEKALQTQTIQPTSMAQAMQAGELPSTENDLKPKTIPDGKPYKTGVLAFLGYFLSYRWTSLRTYQRTFTEREDSIKIDHVLASLVDFDHWLSGKVRSSHESQVILHAKLSELSNGYMRPLVGYNPWRDVKEPGAVLALARRAIENHKFVGIKIYPPNGYFPWGNTEKVPKGPSAAEINRALTGLWKLSDELNVPVMAHTNESMGSDPKHNRYGGPKGWHKLVDGYAKELNLKNPPLVNLGHFGGSGEDKKNNWTQEFADIMEKPGGSRIYGDLGYWTELGCGLVGAKKCEVAQKRLKKALDVKIEPGQTVANRVMYGSDWLMLSKEPNWDRYPNELLESIQKIAPRSVDQIFGGNAQQCFGRI